MTSTSTLNPGRMSPGIPYHTFLGVIWATVALAGVFLLIRIFPRLQFQRRLFWDDAFVIFAFTLALITAVLWQWQAPAMYWVLGALAGTQHFTSLDDVFKKQKLWLRVSLVIHLFFYTSLTAVKLSFLLFFRRLGDRVPKFNWFWWPIVLFVIAIWLASIGDAPYKCELGSTETLNAYCTTEPANRFTEIIIQVNCVLDVLSDFLIMMIPVVLLWNVKMRLGRKLAFIGLFSLSLVTVAVAIARAATLGVTRWANGLHDPSYLWLWSAVEPCIAIIIACLSAFPQLFAGSSRAIKPVNRPASMYYNRLKSWVASRKNSRKNSIDTRNLSVDSLAQGVDPTTSRELAVQRPDTVLQMSGYPEPVMGYYEGSSVDGSPGAGGQMKQRLEYEVTRQWV